MRVVLDTNVLLSAFLWQKGLKSIYQTIRFRKITPCFSQITWEELLRALSYKKFEKQLLKIRITPEEIIQFLSARSYYAISRLQITEIQEDPSDNNILSCAISCGASFIISGDKHLLSLKEFQGTPIITPQKFLGRFK